MNDRLPRAAPTGRVGEHISRALRANRADLKYAIVQLSARQHAVIEITLQEIDRDVPMVTFEPVPGYANVSYQKAEAKYRSLWYALQDSNEGLK